MKPILKVEDGRVGPFERVRTSAKALSRLEELAVEAAGDAEVDVAVAHLASPERADRAGRWLGERLADGLGDREVDLGRDRCGARRARRPGHGGRGRVPAQLSSTPRGAAGLSTGSVGASGQGRLPSVGACAGSHRRRWRRRRVAGSSCSVASSTRPGCAASTTRDERPDEPDEEPRPHCPSRRRWPGRPACRRGPGVRRLAGWVGDQVPGDVARPGPAGSGAGAAGRGPRGAGDGAPRGRPADGRRRPGAVPARSPLPRPRRSPSPLVPPPGRAAGASRRSHGARARDGRRRREGTPSRGGHAAGRLAGGGRAEAGGRRRAAGST